MFRTRLFILLVCCAVFGTALSAVIGEKQAGDIAARFLASRSMNATGLNIAHRAPLLGSDAPSGRNAYYVFNLAQAGQGFVIVAGDDRVPAILGFSDQGTFDAADVPPVLQEWLDGYNSQIQAVAAGGAAEVRTSVGAAIEPMLNVHWGQGSPYNVRFPHISGSSNAHAYTGCVATAMAQVMAYYQYPARPTITIPGYTSSSGNTYAVNMPSLSPVNFAWDEMQDTYYTNDTLSAAADAVTTLMLYCSTALKSNFGLTSTGAYARNVPSTLIDYFGYKDSGRFVRRNNYTTRNWEEIIYAELAAGRPVVYSGNKASGGHAFVCDGYDGEGRFHINWGWAGKSNGYFLLNLLNPSEEGIGSAAGAYGYVYSQGACLGVEPDDGVSGECAEFTFEDLTINSSNNTRSASTANFSVTVSGKFVNNSNVTTQFRQGWGLYKDGELVDVLFIRYTTSPISNGETVSVNARPLSFGAGITSGTYRILPIYSVYPDTLYKPCVGADVNYIEVTFDGTYSCTIKGYGTAGSTTKYTVNACDFQGTLNHGKPVTTILNLTNAGTSQNDLIYMFVDGTFTATGLASIEPGQADDLVYRFTPTTAGSKTLTFSLNENGSSPFYTKKVTINTMPSASLDVSYRILGITDEEGRVITADHYTIIADVTNTGSTPYDEDFSVRLYRINNNETNVGTELLNQSQPLQLAPGESASLQFDFDHDLIDGWRYFCYLYYYSAGQTVGTGTRWYTLNFPTGPVETRNVTAAVNPAEGGVITFMGGVTDGEAQVGKTVLFAVTPSEGYVINNVMAVTADGDTLALNHNANSGNYSFVMPSCDVAVTATAIAVNDISTSLNNAAGGRVALSATQATAGEMVTVTVTPNVGWRCDGVTVTANGSPVPITDGGNGVFTFAMPDGDATVDVIFARDSGSLFKLVDSRSEIAEGDTYVLLSRNYNKVMKQMGDMDETFQAVDVAQWMDESQAVVRINDDACMFTMTQVADTTVSGNARTAAYLTNGNGFMRTGNYNVFLNDEISAESRAWMYIGNASNCLIRFKDTSSGSNANWIVRYDSDADNFKVMNWNVTGAEVSRVWLYKLVDAYQVNTLCMPDEGGTVTLVGGTVDGKAQAGETVVFTLKTATDFTVGGVDVITAAGDTIVPVMDDETGLYSFTMPESDVTISAAMEQPTGPVFILGDVNSDGIVGIADVTLLIDYLLGLDVHIDSNAADVDQNQSISIADVTILIDMMLGTV